MSLSCLNLLLNLGLCPALPGAFQGALHGVLTLNQLDEAVRDTMRCGGCTASRASFIGACFGAQTGLQGIPESWRERTFRYPLLLELAQNLVKNKEQQ
ncbi:crystallin J1B-like protein [Lates japonicus]|uniref:Crystallin J1B-like protein n=1 Tax=Lates japonicus TaxID=270547 RepID=A0AAD3MIB9_LATJO|nr:crystallin J1B-like protein [Lates japonicus]